MKNLIKVKCRNKANESCWRCVVLPMVEMWDGWNSLSVNLHNKHVFPTPESPRSRSRKSTSYCLAIMLRVLLKNKSRSQLTRISDPAPPASHVGSEAQHVRLRSHCCWVGRSVTKQGCPSFPVSRQLPVGAVDHRQVRLSEKMALPVMLFNIKATCFVLLIFNRMC